MASSIPPIFLYACAFMLLVLPTHNIAGASDIVAQDSTTAGRSENVERKVNAPLGSLYVEIGGAGIGLASFHAEVTAYRFSHVRDGLGFNHSIRLSAGYSLDRSGFLSAAATYLALESDHHIEVGVGAAYPMVPREGSDALPKASTVGVLLFGYRFEVIHGILLRATFTPWVDTHTGNWTMYGGASVGVAF